MKQEIPPWVAIVAIIVVVAAIGAWMYTKSGPGATAAQAEKAIQSTVVGGSGPPTMPPNMPGSLAGGPGTGDPGQAGAIRPGGRRK